MAEGKAMRIIPVLLLLAGLLAGCGPAMSFKPPPPTGDYRNEDLKFSLKVPKEWEIRQGLAGQVVVCLSPRGDNFRENLVVSLEPAQTEPKTLEERLTAELQGWKQQREGVSPQGYPFFVGTHNQLGEDLTALVVLAPRSDKEFILTFTARTPEYAKWEPIFLEVLSTLNLDLKPGQTPAPPATPATPAAETPTPATETPAPAAETATPATGTTP